MTVAELRKQTGLSQSKFAKATGVPIGTIQRWEQGYSKPSAYIVVLLEKALKYDGVLKE